MFIYVTWPLTTNYRNPARLAHDDVILAVAFLFGEHAIFVSVEKPSEIVIPSLVYVTTSVKHSNTPSLVEIGSLVSPPRSVGGMPRFVTCSACFHVSHLNYRSQLWFYSHTHGSYDAFLSTCHLMVRNLQIFFHTGGFQLQNTNNLTKL